MIVPNQKIIIINHHDYNPMDIQKAMISLNAGAFKLYMFFYIHPIETFPLSRNEIENNFGLKKKQYDNAIKELIDNHILIQVQSSNTYIFSTISIDNKEDTKDISFHQNLYRSKGEEKIGKLLKENNISFIQEQTFENCYYPNTQKAIYWDFWVANRYIIEYDGEFHKQQITQEKDKFRNQWCVKQNIPLIRIPYKDINNITMLDLALETSPYRIV